MMFEDNYGNLLPPDEVDQLSCYEIEERGIHVHEDAREADELDDDAEYEEDEEGWSRWAAEHRRWRSWFTV
jgi:hypothetical protein